MHHMKTLCEEIIYYKYINKLTLFKTCEQITEVAYLNQ